MQLACNALHQGHHVVWIDTGAPIPGPRFKDMVSSYGIPAGHEPPSSPPIERSMHDLLENMTHFHVPSLAHLLALFLHPTPAFPPANTALIIVDNVSAPFATAFPRSSDVKGGSLDPARRSKLQWAANRKWAVAGDLAAAMVKMAALRSVAVVAISQVATSLKGVGKAVLKSAIAGTAWEAAVHNRIVLWRDFAPHGGGAGVVEPSMARRLRLAKVVKTGRKMKPGNSGDVVAFAVEKACSSKSV